MYADFENEIKKAAESLKKQDPSRVILFHHNDADGLSSGSIVSRACERQGWDVRRYCLEKPYPAVVQFLKNNLIEPADVVIFADFGSGMASTLKSFFSDQAAFIICDHHSIDPDFVPSPNFYLLNPVKFDIKGYIECSASAVCYLFAKALSLENTDCAVAGVLGAIGDRHFENGELKGVNEQIFIEARKAGEIFLEDTYRLYNSPGYSCIEIADGLDILGGIAYFRGGPDIAVKTLTEIPGTVERHFVRQYEGEYNEAYGKLVSNLQLNTASSQFQSFELPEEFNSMGVKTVGLVCDRLIRDKQVSEDCYIVGFQRIPDRIPGIGPFLFDSYKVSFRVPPELFGRVKKQQEPSLPWLIQQISGDLNCFVDACHPHAAAITISLDKKDLLLEILSGVLEGQD